MIADILLIKLDMPQTALDEIIEQSLNDYRKERPRVTFIKNYKNKKNRTSNIYRSSQSILFHTRAPFLSFMAHHLELTFSQQKYMNKISIVFTVVSHLTEFT